MTDPSVTWDGGTQKFFVTLPLSKRGLPALQEDVVVDAEWHTDLTYVVRIRELGTEEWSVGFETPLTTCTFTDLRPDTEYEMEVRTKRGGVLSSPATLKARTDAAGQIKGIGNDESSQPLGSA